MMGDCIKRIAIRMVNIASGEMLLENGNSPENGQLKKIVNNPENGL